MSRTPRTPRTPHALAAPHAPPPHRRPGQARGPGQATRLARALASVMALGALLLVSSAALAGDWSIRAAVKPEAPTTQDIITYTVTVSGTGAAVPQLTSPPAFDDFLVLPTPSSQPLSSPAGYNAQGEAVREHLFFYRLRARRPGTQTLEGLSVRVDGETLRSPPQSVHVTDAGGGGAPLGLPPLSRSPSAPGGAAGRATVTGPGDDYFVEVTRGAERVHVGEPVFVRYDLLRRQSVQGVPIDVREPELNGFIPHDATSEHDMHMRESTTRQGIPYEQELLKAYVLVPIEAGAATLAPTSVEVLPEHRAMQRAYWIASAPATLEVLPLPAGAPDGFHPNNVGAELALYPRLVASDGRTLETLRRGDTVTVSLEIAGYGAVPSMQIAPPSAQPGLFYLPSRVEETEDIISDVRLRGRKRINFEVAVLEEGTLTLPALRLVYFDTEADAYEETTAGPWTLHVEGESPDLPQIMTLVEAAGRDADAPAGARADGRPGPRASSLRAVGAAEPVYQHAWFLALLAVGPLLYVGAVLGGAARRRRAASAPDRRARGASRRVQRALERAEARLEEGQTVAFYEALVEALGEHLEARLGLRLRALTSGEIVAALRGRGLDAAQADAAARLVIDAQAARYAAPDAASGSGALRQELACARDLIAAIDRVEAAR